MWTAKTRLLSQSHYTVLTFYVMDFYIGNIKTYLYILSSLSAKKMQVVEIHPLRRQRPIYLTKSNMADDGLVMWIARALAAMIFN